MNPNSQKNEIISMFGRIAPRYDLINRLMTGGLDQGWRQKATLKLIESVDFSSATKPQFLDLATGTGDLAFRLARTIEEKHPGRAFQIDAVDAANEMLERAQTKQTQLAHGNKIHFRRATMEEIPFPDETFDGILIGFGIRNAFDRSRALHEMLRVLKPGGRLTVLEALPARTPWGRLGQSLHFKLTVQLLGSILSEGEAYRYLGNSVREFPNASRFAQLLLDTGFMQIDSQELSIGAVSLIWANKVT